MNQAPRSLTPPAVAAAALALAASCATVPPPLPHAADAPASHWQVRAAASSRADTQVVTQALGIAIARQTLPALQHAGTVEVVADHAALVDIVGRPLDWLRAWARFDQVFLQAPSTWHPRAPTPTELAETLTHELAHAALFQATGDRSAGVDTNVPFWFREGHASVVAGQGYRWASLPDLAARPRAELHELLTDGDNAATKSMDLAYGAAHHLVTFLSRRYGTDAVSRVAAGVALERDFDAGFTRVLGIEPERLVREFEHYVAWKGFRGSPQSTIRQPRRRARRRKRGSGLTATG